MRSLALASLVLVGCVFDGGDDDPPCYDYATGEAQIPAQLYRNPATGECQGFGGYPCDSRCGPCPGFEQADPDWGSCYSTCDGLAEGTCKTTAGCFAAYMEFPTQDRNAEYLGCWQTAPSGPLGGSCANLDAQQCSRHDNCTAHYEDNPAADPSTHFLLCKDEVAAAACSTLATEAACSARAYCVPTYRGDDCTCTPDGCECNVMTYQQCDAR